MGLTLEQIGQQAKGAEAVLRTLPTNQKNKHILRKYTIIELDPQPQTI